MSLEAYKGKGCDHRPFPNLASDLERERVLLGDALLAVGRGRVVLGRRRSALSRRPPARVAGARPEGDALAGALGARLLVEGAQVEDALEERPGEGEVGRDDGGRGLPDVPERPVQAEGVREAVVLVEDGGEDLGERKSASSTRAERRKSGVLP